jgi:hypothetical protein
MDEPLEKLFLCDLLTTAPRPEIAAATLLGGAVRGQQGAKCAICGTVMRKLGEGRRMGVTVLYFEMPETPEDSFFAIACSEFCRERATRRFGGWSQAPGDGR